MVNPMFANLQRIGFIETDADLIKSYCRGQRGEEGQASFLARPRTTEELSELVRYCVQNKITLVPQSGRTGLVGSSVPSAEGHQAVVSLERLNAHCVLGRTNRSVTCSAGVRLSELNRHLPQK